jgi:hypothetical protein
VSPSCSIAFIRDLNLIPTEVAALKTLCFSTEIERFPFAFLFYRKEVRSAEVTDWAGRGSRPEWVHAVLPETLGLLLFAAHVYKAACLPAGVRSPCKGMESSQNKAEPASLEGSSSPTDTFAIILPLKFQWTFFGLKLGKPCWRATHPKQNLKVFTLALTLLPVVSSRQGSGCKKVAPFILEGQGLLSGCTSQTPFLRVS